MCVCVCSASVIDFAEWSTIGNGKTGWLEAWTLYVAAEQTKSQTVTHRLMMAVSRKRERGTAGFPSIIIKYAPRRRKTGHSFMLKSMQFPVRYFLVPMLTWPTFTVASFYWLWVRNTKFTGQMIFCVCMRYHVNVRHLALINGNGNLEVQCVPHTHK